MAAIELIDLAQDKYRDTDYANGVIYFRAP
jgi:hypothetical protein